MRILDFTIFVMTTTRRSWMSFRYGAVGALLIMALAFAGCASPGNGPSPEGALAQDYDEDDLPQWMQELPEGTEPRDNEHTDEAVLYLVQAMSAEEGERARFYQQALEAAEAGIEADPENPQSYYQAGEALLGLGELERAGEMFDRAEELHPRYKIDTEFLREEAWLEAFNSAAELAQEGDREAAKPYFEQAHAIYQGRPEAMLNLAEYYQEEGRLEEASELYQKSLDVIDGPRTEGMDEEVLAQWAEYREIALFNRAQLLFQAERYAEAAEIYEEILEEDPESLMAISNLAVSLVAAGEEERARAIYDDLMNRPGLDARDMFSIGVGLYQAEDFEQSARAFGEAWSAVPNHRDAAFNHLQALFIADQVDEFLDVAEQVIEVDPNNLQAYQMLAQTLVQQDREPEAVEVIDRMEALPFFVRGLELHPVDGGVALVGQVVNNQVDAEGSTARLRIRFYNTEGEEVGTAETEVELAGYEEPVQFQADLATDRDVFGFRYEVL